MQALCERKTLLPLLRIVINVDDREYTVSRAALI